VRSEVVTRRIWKEFLEMKFKKKRGEIFESIVSELSNPTTIISCRDHATCSAAHHLTVLLHLFSKKIGLEIEQRKCSLMLVDIG
jgi:hypothetical protein